MNPARDKITPRLSPDAPMAIWFLSASGMDGSEGRQTGADRQVSVRTGRQAGAEQADGCLPQGVTRGSFRLACSTTQEIFSPDLLQHIRASVRRHLGLVEPQVSVLDSPGRVLQVGVQLVVPVPVCQLLGGGHIMADLSSIPEPAHFDVLGVKVVNAADQHG